MSGKNDVEVVYEVIRLPSKTELEKNLLFGLTECRGPIPSRWNEFSSFVNRKFEYRFPRETVKTIWTQMKNMDDYLNKRVTEVIQLSSDEEESDLKPKQTDIAEKRSKKVKKSKSPKQETISKTDEKELERKIRKEVVLKEMIKRDQEMLQILPSEDRANRKEQVQLEYSKRMDKQRIDMIVSEKLQSIKTRVGPSTAGLETEVVETELEGGSVIEVAEEKKEETSKKGRIKKKGKGDAEETPHVQVRHSPRKVSKESSSEEGSSGKRGRSRRATSVGEDEAEKLRRDLLINKLIEVSLPDIPKDQPDEKPTKKKSKRSV